VKAHNDSGHLSYLLGRTGTTGWWYFYLVALAVKTPIPLLAAGPVGVAWLARDGWRDRNPWALAPAVLIVTLLTFASLFSHINIGIRHILVLYPFLAIGAAHVAVRAWRSLAALRPRRAATGGTADLKREPLPAFVVLGSRRPVSGWVAISELARTRNPADYAWLDAYRPLERIGKSIDLYYIP